MGSLVMTSTHAPDFGLQHPYHHRRMVDSDQYESDRPSGTQRARDRASTAPHTAHGTAHDNTTASDTHEPAAQNPAAAQQQPSEASAAAPASSDAATIHVPVPAPATTTSTASTATAARPRQPYQPRNAAQHTHTPTHTHTHAYDQAGFPLTSDPGGLTDASPSSPRLLPTYRSARSLAGSEVTSPSRIKVRDLSHIQSFASEEYLSRRLARRTASSFSESGRQYEISSMPVTDIIEMVAGLLTKITATNDRQHEHVHRPIPPPEEHGTMHPQASCVLAFHGKNVPSITILSYLSRIHKYCPATYEVFLSLLVYFDRMTDLVNSSLLQSMQRAAIEPTSAPRPSTAPTTTATTTATSTAATTTATTPQSPQPTHSDTPMQVATPPASAQPQIPPSPPGIGGPDDMSQFFVVDSYNIHRLVIAGVTCASKFFSDVFYTNSRYAKVGGLPLVELNHLELQFLILNDFRLSIAVEELEAYGTMLVEFYAREIVAQQQQQQQQHHHHHPSHSQHLSPALASPASPHSTEAMYMRESSTRGQESR